MRDDIFKYIVEDHSYVDRILFGKLTHPIIDKTYNMGLTPNFLTTLSFICQISSVVFLYNKKIYLFAIFYLLGYYFDCVDGPMARKYDMVTRLGDWYDHFTDIFSFILINYLFIKKYNILDNKIILFIYLTMFIGMLFYIGCQERIYNKGLKESEKSSETLFLTTYLVKDPEDLILKIRFFCFTHFNIFVSIIPILLTHKLC